MSTYVVFTAKSQNIDQRISLIIVGFHVKYGFDFLAKHFSNPWAKYVEIQNETGIFLF